MSLTDATPGMIPRIIGQKGKSIKKIISSAWRMYDNYQDEGKGVGENKPRLVIKITNQEETVSAEIITESDIMRKFAVHSLKTVVSSIVAKSTSNEFKLYVEMSPSCIGLLLGKKAQLMRSDMSSISDEIDSDYEETYGEIVKKTWTKITEHHYTDLSELVDIIQNDPKKSFIGFPPESTDSEIVEILVSSRGLPENVFLDLVNRLSERLDTRIKRIVSRHQETMASIDEALGFDEYSPDSPGYSPR